MLWRKSRGQLLIAPERRKRLGHFRKTLIVDVSGDESKIRCCKEKYCILDSLVDHDGCSISSKGFLPTVVDMMAI